MEEVLLLSKEEYDVFNLFSKKLIPTTKQDYLSKILLFKDFLKDKELIEADKEDCRLFIEKSKEIYAKSTCEKVYSYLHSFYNFLKKEEYIEIKPFRNVEKTEVTRIKKKY